MQVMQVPKAFVTPECMHMDLPMNPEGGYLLCPRGSDFFSFNFLMLHYWLASQEGFSINWQQLFLTCLNIFKILVLNNATKVKSESKCHEIQNLVNFFRKTGLLQQNIYLQ